MHQIRIHLAFLKAPITGDEVYGGKLFYVSSIKRKFNLKKMSEEQPLMKRMALHAFSLEFALLDGEKKLAEAPYPKDFQALIRQLSENLR
jgi:23S rRNA pseudouridine955/2504/2580 synthase